MCGLELKTEQLSRSGQPLLSVGIGQKALLSALPLQKKKHLQQLLKLLCEVIVQCNSSKSNNGNEAIV